MLPLLKPRLGDRERQLVNECLDREWLTYRAPIVGQFESLVSDRVGCNALGTTSGTAALHIALMSLGIGQKDEVILPAISFGTTASVVLAVGATPIYVDTDDRGCITRDSIKSAITRKTKAIIVVHLYGEIAEDVTDLGIPVIEDACEAFGYRNPKARFTCYSFFANKDMTTGEGGMLLGDDLENAKRYRDGGFDENYSFLVPGLNYRITALQAALGIAQLDTVDANQTKKEQVCNEYRKHLKGVGKWLFVAMVDDPKRIKQKLSSMIETRRVFPLFVTQPAFSNHQSAADFPNARYFFNHGLCLPTGWHISITQASWIAEKIIECR